MHAVQQKMNRQLTPVETLRTINMFSVGPLRDRYLQRTLAANNATHTMLAQCAQHAACIVATIQALIVPCKHNRVLIFSMSV